MEFVSLDFEYADRLLPSICSISIIRWKDGVIEDEYRTLINPDCEIEEFFVKRHGITDAMVKDKPTLPQIWKTIYEKLDGMMVFAHKANVVITDLRVRAQADYLNMPDLVYGDTMSISKRVWKHFDKFDLPYLNERLALSVKTRDAYHDAIAVGKIVNMAIKERGKSNYIELFEEIGFAGGFILEQEKISYRAVNREGVYITRLRLPKKEYSILNRLGLAEIV